MHPCQYTVLYTYRKSAISLHIDRAMYNDVNISSMKIIGI